MRLPRNADQPPLGQEPPLASPPETPAPVPDDPERMLRLPEVMKLVPVSKATIWRLVRAKKLPAPIRVSTNAVAWRRADILDYVRQCQRDQNVESR